MSDVRGQPWSHNPYAPNITHHLYVQEKATLAVTFIEPILYGLLVVLFFRCMAALFNPVRRRGDAIKCGIVSYTVVMFLIVTALTGIQFDIHSLCYIENRGFPGAGDALPPGPLGYHSFISSDTLTVVHIILFFLNAWLADGLLLYRCYIIYSKSLWAIAFPCLMYLGSLAMGILLIAYQAGGQSDSWRYVDLHFGLPYLLISILLNILLTLMIVTRLILHVRVIRTAMGGPDRISGLYKAIVTMLIESSALYAVSSLLVIGSWVAGEQASIIFFPLLAQTQVIAPLLIIQRVANQNALTGETAVSAQISEFRARSGGQSTAGSGIILDGDPMRSAYVNGKNYGELEVQYGHECDRYRPDTDKV